MIAVSGTFDSAPELRDQPAGCNCCARNDLRRPSWKKIPKKIFHRSEELSTAVDNFSFPATIYP
jgi:hypothetical protein